MSGGQVAAVAAALDDGAYLAIGLGEHKMGAAS